jgi:hypothetical protein
MSVTSPRRFGGAVNSFVETQALTGRIVAWR